MEWQNISGAEKTASRDTIVNVSGTTRWCAAWYSCFVKGWVETGDPSEGAMDPPPTLFFDVPLPPGPEE